MPPCFNSSGFIPPNILIDADIKRRAMPRLAIIEPNLAVSMVESFPILEINLVRVIIASTTPAMIPITPTDRHRSSFGILEMMNMAADNISRDLAMLSISFPRASFLIASALASLSPLRLSKKPFIASPIPLKDPRKPDIPDAIPDTVFFILLMVSIMTSKVPNAVIAPL